MSTQTFAERHRARVARTSRPRVSRSDIRLEEHPAELTFDGRIAEAPYWEAKLDGQLSTGEWVELSRQGGTFTAALQNLEAIITQNGWEITS